MAVSSRCKFTLPPMISRFGIRTASSILCFILIAISFMALSNQTSSSEDITLEEYKYGQNGQWIKWAKRRLGLEPRNITADLIQPDTSKGWNLLDSERKSAKMLTSAELENLPGFNGNFRDFDSLAPGPYLPNYANPCWYEQRPEESRSLYSANCLVRRGHDFRRLSKKALASSLARLDTQEEYMEELPHKWRLRCLPNIYLIGGDKCGTSAMALYLQDHPFIVKAAFKELRYWSDFRETCSAPLSDYADMFDKASERIRTLILPPLGASSLPYHAAMTVDATPSTYKQYICLGVKKADNSCSGKTVSVAHIIKKITPDAYILAMVRNPVDRAYSSYIFTSSVHDNRTVDEITFDRDVKKFIAKYQKCMVNHTMDFCVLGQSYGQNLTEQEKTVFLGAIYSIHFRHFLDAFGSKMKVIKFEDFVDGTRAARDEFTEFVGFSKLENFYNRGVVNRGPPHNAMLMKTRNVLNEFYRPFNIELERMFGISYI